MVWLVLISLILWRMAGDLTIDKNGAVGMDEMNRPSSGGDNGAVGMDEMNKSPERGGGVQMGAWLN